MSTFGIDQGALIDQISNATAGQGEAVRQAFEQATLKALQGRELTLKHIKDVLKMVSGAASAGVGRNTSGADQVEALLGQTIRGIDAAVGQAVDANRRALQQLVDQGVQLRETQFKKALSNIEKMEDAMFSAIQRTVAGTAPGVPEPWSQVLTAFKHKGTATGANAAEAVLQVTSRAQAAAREGRALGQRAAQVLLDHYAALASGVLIGMAAGLHSAQGAATSAEQDRPADAETPPAKRSRATAKRVSAD